MTGSQLAPWLTIGAAILAAGMWLGSLQTRVTVLEQRDHFLNGSYALPEGTK